jgi:acetyl-CoA C-acetyltransferase
VRSDRPVIVDALRTPIGTERGMFRAVTVDRLVTPLIVELVSRCTAPDRIGQVILGNVRGPGGNLARYCALDAGLPRTVTGLTVDQQCGSGLAAIECARGALALNPGLVLAGGAQSASTQPLTFWPGAGAGEPEEFNCARFAPERFDDPGMGPAADLLAGEHGVSRQRQDAYASRSHERAVRSIDAGVFDDEIVPIDGIRIDERPRRGFTVQRLARFRPVFRPGGTVTAANSCGVNDGAAMVLMADAVTHARLGVPGLRILDAVTVGGDPSRPGFGVAQAVRLLYERTGLGPDDFDAVECNEAFSGQILACLDAIGIPDERNCVQGGALALGHPWAATGAILMTRLFTQMVREGGGGRGLAAIAIAGGMGAAMAVEAC